MGKVKISKYLLFTFALVFFTNTAEYLNAQQVADSVSTSAVEARGDAPDENIEVEAGENIKGAEIDAPAVKGGEAGERAASRYVNFDNWTDLYIKTYVDGVYQGTIAPWGNMRIYVPSGRTYRLYARADFNDGTYLYWGGRDRYIGNSFNWRLNP